MRRPTLVLLGIAAPVALATAIFFYHWRANRVQAEEGIAFNPPELNVGPIPPGQSKHFDFVLANLHDGETRIRGVEATCGCMDVQLSRPSAARGENITVAGSIRPGLKPGPFRQRITFFLSTPGDPDDAVNYQILGRVDPEITVDPETAVLSPDLLSQEPGDGFLIIHNGSTKQVTVEQPFQTAQGLTLRFERNRILPGENAKVFLRCEPFCVTETKIEISLTTTHPYENLLKVPIVIKPRNGLTVSPAAISLGVTKKAYLLQKGSIKLTLSGTILESMELDDVAMPPFLRWEKKSGPLKNPQDLVFRLADDFSGMDVKGEVAIILRLRQESAKVPRKQETLVVRVPTSGILR